MSLFYTILILYGDGAARPKASLDASFIQSRTSWPEEFAGRNTPAAPARSTASYSSSSESQSSSVDEPP